MGKENFISSQIIKDIVVAIAVFIYLNFVGMVFADGTQWSPPYCFFEKTCDYFMKDVVADLSEYSNQLVFIEKNFSTSECTRPAYRIVSDMESSWPSIDNADSFPIAIRKDYFLKKGGLSGLFSTKTESAPIGFPEFKENCKLLTVMEPKNEIELSQNTIEFFASADDVAIADIHYNNERWRNLIKIKIGSTISEFVEFPDYLSIPYEEAPLPNVIRHKDYYYQPAGFFCENAITCKKLVFYRYKEVWTLDNGKEEVHLMPKPNFQGLVSVLSPLAIPATVAATPSLYLTSSPSTKQQTPIIATATPQPRQIIPTIQSASTPMPRISWWKRIWCFVVSIFGVSCK